MRRHLLTGDVGNLWEPGIPPLGPHELDIRLERHRFQTGVNRFKVKSSNVREAIRAYFADPIYNLPKRAIAYGLRHSIGLELNS